MRLLSFLRFTIFSVVVFAFSITTHAQFGATDFLIADFNNGRIAVYDQNLVFQRYLDTGFNQVSGLDFLSNGNLVAVGRNPGRIKIYNSSGTVVNSFTDTNIGLPIDIKARSNLLFIGANSSGVKEFTTVGTFNRTFGSRVFSGTEDLPGGILWAGTDINNPGNIDVFDISTGTMTSTITLDNGQTNAPTMFYSGSTSTILTSNNVNFPGRASIYERDLSGTFVREFTYPTGDSNVYGVTRGPNGDVYATDFFTNVVHRWNASGTYQGSTSIAANVSGPINIVWSGNLFVTAAKVSISGRVLTRIGRAIPRTLISLKDKRGNTKVAYANPFGYFKFKEVEAGQTYVLDAKHKKFTFSPQVISAQENITNINLIAKN